MSGHEGSLPWRRLCPQEGSAHGNGVSRGSGPIDSPVMPKRKEANVGEGDLEKKGTWSLPARCHGRSQVGTHDPLAQPCGLIPGSSGINYPECRRRCLYFLIHLQKGEIHGNQILCGESSHWRLW